MLTLAMIFAELFNAILFWCVYQDVSKYTSLPYFGLAQFIGVVVMINIGIAVFRSESAYMYYHERIERLDRLKYKISSMIACIVLTGFYYICKIFM